MTDPTIGILSDAISKMKAILDEAADEVDEFGTAKIGPLTFAMLVAECDRAENALAKLQPKE